MVDLRTKIYISNIQIKHVRGTYKKQHKKAANKTVFIKTYPDRHIELLEISRAKWVSFIYFVVSITTRQLAVEF